MKNALAANVQSAVREMRRQPTTRSQVLAAEERMLELPQVEIPLREFFAHKLYAREIVIPAGTTLTGKVHKHASLNILAAGEHSVLTEEGIQRVCAPFVVVSPPGTKRIGYAHTECVWITVHGTELVNRAEIEAECVAQTEEEWLRYLNEHRDEIEAERRLFFAPKPKGVEWRG